MVDNACARKAIGSSCIFLEKSSLVNVNILGVEV